MISFTSGDIEQIKDKNFDYFNVHQFNLSCGSVYIKKCCGNESFMELLGKKVFDIVGIDCPNYYYMNGNYVVSDDLHKLDKFIYMNDVPGVSDSITWRTVTFKLVCDFLCEICNNKEEVKLQLIIMHFVDILFSNTDRHLNNYGVYFDEEGNAKIVVFDNGLLLDYFDCVTKPMSCVVNESTFIKMREFRHFLNNLSEEQIRYIYEIYCRFNTDVVRTLIDKVEKENGVKLNGKNRLIFQYTKNHLMVGAVLNKYVTNKTKREVHEMKLSKSS